MDVKGRILGGAGVVDTLDLDQAGLGVVDVARALVGQVTSPMANKSAMHPS